MYQTQLSLTQEQSLAGLTSRTVVHQQVRPQAPLFEGSHSCGRWGEDLRHGDAEAEPLELGNERLPGRLALVGAEAQLQVGGLEPVRVSKVALDELLAARDTGQQLSAQTLATV